MKINQAIAAAPQFQPVTVTLTLENEDDVRWLYHVTNLQQKEIVKAYAGNRKGDFADRFTPYADPDGKKALFQHVRDIADQQGVSLHDAPRSRLGAVA